MTSACERTFERENVGEGTRNREDGWLHEEADRRTDGGQVRGVDDAVVDQREAVGVGLGGQDLGDREGVGR